MTEGALEGLLVLDGSQMFSGPMCGMRLGDLGADVLKIEPLQGEWARQRGFLGVHDLAEETLGVLALNRNKRSVGIDLKSDRGREVFYELARLSDVFIQNYRVGTAERLGVGYETLHKLNPRLIYCSISGYGETGPYVDRPGQDLVIQAYSGSMWMVGSKSDSPTPSALWAVDSIAGYQATIGILGALVARGRSDKGQKVEVNLLAAVMDCQVQELTTYLNTGYIAQRSQEWSAHAMMPGPYGVYQTADGYIALPMQPLDQLGVALENDRLREMKSWNDGLEYKDEIIRIVRQIMPTRTTAEWLARLDSFRLWAGPVYTYKDLAEDPHVVATGMVASVEHPTVGTLRVPNIPIRLSETPTSIRLPPPTVGQHTREVLKQYLGYDEKRIEELHKSGAI